MAHVEFDAFVESLVVGTRTGEVFALRSAETHRRKGEDGRYTTTARTYRVVKMANNTTSTRAGATDTLEGFQKGDRVHVRGVEKTERYSKPDGADVYTLTVYADEVTLAHAARSVSAVVEDGDEPF